MPSTLGFAILGLLARQPQTGYDLARQMRTPIGFFWSSTHSQIYPELHRLQADQLVTHRVVDGPGPRDTKRYEITDVGLAELRTWVVSPLNEQPERDEFTLRIFSLWLVEPAAAKELIRRHRESHAERLETYCEREREINDEAGPAATNLRAPEFATMASLRAGLGYERHRIAWCDWLLDRLAAPPAFDEDETAPSGPPPRVGGPHDDAHSS